MQLLWAKLHKVRVRPRHLLHHTLLRVQQQPLLIHVVKHRPLADRDLALRRLLLAHQHPQQRRLAQPVAADDPRACPRFKAQVQVAEKPPVIHTRPDVRRIDHRVRQRCRRRNNEIHHQLLLRRIHRRHTRILIQSRSLLRPPRAHPRPHKFQLMPQKALTPPLRVRLHTLTDRLALQKVTVVPRVAVDPAVVDLDDPRRHPVQKVPVMRHKQHRPRKLPQENLKPLDRLRIQVVRRLIQQQQVRLRHQRTRQRHAPLFTTREPLHHTVRRRHPQLIHRCADPRLHTPPVVQLDLVQQLRLLVPLVVAVFIPRHHLQQRRRA